MTAPLRASTSPYTQDSLPIERIFTTKEFTPILLSHYFSGLKEHNPLKGFIGFYNVLEYYFEEAPRMLKRSASNERAQLECVVDLLTTADEIKKFISLLEPSSRQVVFADMPTSSGIVIKGFDKKIQNQVELARWLYEIRCAVVHSKKTRSGRVTPAFEPYSSKSLVLRCVLPIVQWLAVLCIEKDYDLRAAAA